MWPFKKEITEDEQLVKELRDAWDKVKGIERELSSRNITVWLSKYGRLESVLSNYDLHDIEKRTIETF